MFVVVVLKSPEVVAVLKTLCVVEGARLRVVKVVSGDGFAVCCTYSGVVEILLSTCAVDFTAVIEGRLVMSSAVLIGEVCDVVEVSFSVVRISLFVVNLSAVVVCRGIVVFNVVGTVVLAFKVVEAWSEVVSSFAPVVVDITDVDFGVGRIRFVGNSFTVVVGEGVVASNVMGTVVLAFRVVKTLGEVVISFSSVVVDLIDVDFNGGRTAVVVASVIVVFIIVVGLVVYFAALVS